MSESQIPTSKMTLRERCIIEEKSIGVKRRGSDENSLDSFSGENSFVPKRSATKKSSGVRGAKYDGRGIHKESNKDLCDCLDIDCPGCFFPCEKCFSCKCGHECRANRRWMYESYKIEGTNMEIKNVFRKPI